MQNQDIIEKSKWWDRFRRADEELVLPVTGDWVLVEKIKPPEFKTQGGIVIASGITTHKQTTDDMSTRLGLVLAAGPGQYLEDGTVVPCNHKIGDIVMLPHTTEWFDVFFNVHLGEAQIGRVRDYQIPMGTTDLKKLQTILHGL
jgi:co-chaperonin GroES (HSP10)